MTAAAPDVPPLFSDTRIDLHRLRRLAVTAEGRTGETSIRFNLYDSDKDAIGGEIQLALELGICSAILYLTRDQLLALSEAAFAAADHLSPVS